MREDLTTLSPGSPKTVCISDIYIVIHISSRISVRKWKWKYFYDWGVTTTCRAVLKGRSIRKAESHCSVALLSRLKGTKEVLYLTLFTMLINTPSIWNLLYKEL